MPCSGSTSPTTISTCPGGGKGAGPVFLNLILHDVDNLRYLLGEVVAVQAVESNAVRANAVEDTSAIILEFACGHSATVSVCEYVVGALELGDDPPGENPAYPVCRRGLLSPRRHRGLPVAPQARSLVQRPETRLWEPLHRNPTVSRHGTRWPCRSRHFAAVIRGLERPLVDGREGLRTLESSPPSSGRPGADSASACRSLEAHTLPRRDGPGGREDIRPAWAYSRVRDRRPVACGSGHRGVAQATISASPVRTSSRSARGQTAIGPRRGPIAATTSTGSAMRR